MTDLDLAELARGAFVLGALQLDRCGITLSARGVAALVAPPRGAAALAAAAAVQHGRR